VLFAGPPDPGNEVCHFHLDPDRVEAAFAGRLPPRVAPEAEIR